MLCIRGGNAPAGGGAKSIIRTLVQTDAPHWHGFSQNRDPGGPNFSLDAIWFFIMISLFYGEIVREALFYRLSGGPAIYSVRKMRTHGEELEIVCFRTQNSVHFAFKI